MNEEKYLGQWWLPNKPEDIVYGELIVQKNRNFTLRLIGSFGDLESLFSVTISSLDAIQGFTTCGKNVTLFNCTKSVGSMHAPGMITEQYSAQIMAIGSHYNNLENIRFKSISFSMNNLETWLLPDTFSVSHYDTPDHKVEVHYSIPETKTYAYGEYKLRFPFTSSVEGDLITEVTVSQIAWVEIVSEETFGIKNVYDFMTSFANLISIACMKKITIKALKGLDSEENKLVIQYRGEDIIDDNEKSNIGRYDLLFSIKTVGDVNVFFRLWMDKQELLAPIIQYFVEAHKKETYSSISFLKMVQAVEAFSRRARRNWVDEQQEHKNRMNSILEEISEDCNKKWLNGVLKHINEPSLATRLKGLFKETNFLLNISTKNISSAIFKIVETRNYYTHFDESKKDIAYDARRMYYVGQYLFHMLRTLILLELGFSEGYILENISKNGELFIIKDNLGW